jgi:hypothetical protein
MVKKPGTESRFSTRPRATTVHRKSSLPVAGENRVQNGDQCKDTRHFNQTKIWMPQKKKDMFNPVDEHPEFPKGR